MTTTAEKLEATLRDFLNGTATQEQVRAATRAHFGIPAPAYPGMKVGETVAEYLEERRLQHAAFMGGEGDEVWD